VPFVPEISIGSGVPIFRQVVDQIRLAVATGRLAEGEQLPSVRLLAERLLVNPNTIAKAYSELARERVIDAWRGRGVFIAPLRQMYNKAERARRLTPLLDALVNEGVTLGYDADEIVDALRQRLAKLKLIEPAKSERGNV
jgi:GntR family transcriptional regulator